jgi:hypothetical protein
MKVVEILLAGSDMRHEHPQTETLSPICVIREFRAKNTYKWARWDVHWSDLFNTSARNLIICSALNTVILKYVGLND